jgi:tetratricopeptide (TPR) repeat protein
MNGRNTLVLVLILVTLVVSAFAQTNPCTKNDDECIITYQTKLIQADKNNSEAYYARALAYKHVGNYIAEEEDLDKYLSFDIKNKAWLADGLRERAMLRRQNGALKEAVWDLGKAIEEYANEREAYNLRGQIYIDLTFFDEAIADFTKYIALSGGYPEDKAYGHWGRAEAYNRTKKYNLAVKDLGLAIQIKATDPLFYQERAFAYRSLGQKALAAADDAKAIALQK